MNLIARRHFFFVRHAETDWNHLKLCQGQKDIPLNNKGIQEAKAFALATQTLSIDCIISSPLSRALQTAQEIHHIHSHADLQIVDELSERSWGLLEGISSEEMYAIESLEKENPLHIPGKNVEERTAFHQRILRGIAIAQSYHSHPLIVSHGRLFMELCSVLGIPPVHQLHNCQLVKITPKNNSWIITTIQSSVL